MSVNTAELWLIEPFYIFLIARFLLFTVFHLTVEGRHLWDFFSYYDLQSPGFDGRAHNRTRWCLRVKSMCQPSPDSGLPSHPRILSSLVSSAFLGGSSVLQTGASHTAPFLTDYTNSFHTRGRTAPPPIARLCFIYENCSGCLRQPVSVRRKKTSPAASVAHGYTWLAGKDQHFCQMSTWCTL